MKSSFSPSRLRVFSAFFVNLAAGWFIALFVTKDPVVLTTEFLASMLSLELAFRIERELEKT